jgi:hypothetical protein
MNNNVEKAINDFIDVSDEQGTVNKTQNNFNKNLVLNEREGLIERVDKVFVTKDGKQLLREQY